MKQPIEPKPEDCCNSGCNPCVFDVYQNQILMYKKYLENGDTVLSCQNAISQLNCSDCILQNCIDISKDHRALFFKLRSDNNNYKIHWSPGDHFLVKYTTNNMSCSRAYTPLEPKSYFENYVCEKSDFLIVVKKYVDGIVSNYLYNLRPGQITLWRGPYGSYEIIANKFNKIIMIAQGTGILPFLSVINYVLDNEDDNTKIILYYCCENNDSILFRDKLYEYRSFWNFSYKIFLSKSLKKDNYKYLEPIVNHKFNIKEISCSLPLSEDVQILLCGSAQFMEYYKSGLQELDAGFLNIKCF